MSKIKAVGMKAVGFSLVPAEYTLRGAGGTCHGTATALRKIAQGFDYLGDKSVSGADYLKRTRSNLMLEADALLAEAAARKYDEDLDEAAAQAAAQAVAAVPSQQ